MLGTAWSQGCLAVTAGPESPRGQGEKCWHLVSAKRVCHPVCKISLNTGPKEKHPRGLSVCVHPGLSGWGRGTPTVSPWLWLVSPSQIARAQCLFPDCGVFSQICLSVCAFVQNTSSPGSHCLEASSLWNCPPGEAPSHSSSCSRERDGSPKTKPLGGGLSSCQFDGLVHVAASVTPLVIPSL